MKTVPLLSAFALIVFSPLSLAQSQTNGFLIFEVERFTYAQGNPAGLDVKQSFKVPLTAEFTSQFKNLPSPTSMGTGFWCGGGNVKAVPGSTRFTSWIRKTKDNRWSIDIWGQGTETVQGTRVSSTNPTASQWFTINRLEDLDTRYLLSYVRRYDGINVSLRVKYVAEQEVNGLSDIPTFPVKKTDQSELLKGDDLGKFPLELKGGFQEG